MLEFRRWIWVGVIISLAAGCGRFSSTGKPDDQSSKRVREAETLSEARDYRRAAELYEEALRIQPENADAHFKVAVIYDKKLDQFLPAIYHYDAFLRLEPDTERSKLATDFMNNAHFQYVATLPQFKTLANPDTAKIQTENEALHRQVGELKTELIRLRSEASKPAELPEASPPSVAKAKKTTTPIAPAANTYRVQKGDGLQSIAHKVYGDRSRWRDIFDANPQLNSPTDLKPGQVLRIP